MYETSACALPYKTWVSGGFTFVSIAQEYFQFNIIFVQISEEPTNTLQYYAQGEGKTELVETDITQCQDIPMDIIEHAPHDGANLYTSLGVFTSLFPRENPTKIAIKYTSKCELRQNDCCKFSTHDVCTMQLEIFQYEDNDI